MRKLMLAAVAAVAFAVPSLSHAQVQFGLRLGFAPAMGDAFDGGKMSDGVKSQVPIQVDALYAVMPNLKVGAYFSYGFGQLASGLPDDASARDMRFGVEGIYSFAPVKQFTPWAGAGVGYEIASYDSGADTLKTDGFEFLNLQLGADYKVNQQLAVGPFVQFSLGQYSTVNDETVPSSEKAMHNWLQFGVRGTFDL